MTPTITIAAIMSGVLTGRFMRKFILVLLFATVGHTMEENGKPKNFKIHLKNFEAKIGKPFIIYQFLLNKKKWTLSYDPAHFSLLESSGDERQPLYRFDPETGLLSFLHYSEDVKDQEQDIYGKDFSFLENVPKIEASDISLAKRKGSINQIIALINSEQYLVLSHNSLATINDAQGKRLMKFNLLKNWSGDGEVTAFNDGNFAILHRQPFFESSSLYFGKKAQAEEIIFEKCKSKKGDPFIIFQSDVQNVALSQNPSIFSLIQIADIGLHKLYFVDPRMNLMMHVQTIDDKEKGLAESGQDEEFLNNLEEVSASKIGLKSVKKSINKILRLDDDLFLVLPKSSPRVFISDRKGKALMEFALSQALGVTGEITIFNNGNFALLHRINMLSSKLYFGKKRRLKKH